MPRLASLVVVFLATLGGAVAAAAEPASSRNETIDFSRQIRPLLARACLRCHGPDAEARQAGLRLDDRAAAVQPLESGASAIVPGKPEASAIVGRIFAADADERMPPPDAGKLDPAERELIKRWIASGAAYATHWAFQPPVRPELPPVANLDWVRNPIDRFTLARLDREGLKPSPEAHRHLLIRRLSMDLTGLPPTIAEVDAFVADQDPKAYENLVDRLLKSPAYGERWARVWLDLARYADSAGYAQDPARTIWRYRDWVIQAINRNLPFDQFTIEQLAGDLLPDATDDQLIATAFHRNTMTNSEGGTDDEEFRNAAIVDRVNTTMQVWMGLTMGCAQCHSHKYDPISQKEYFQFFAVFNNTADADRGDESPTLLTMAEADSKRKAGLQMQVAALKKEREAKAQSLAKSPPTPTGPLATRFVRIELPGKGAFLSLAEVQVFAGKKNLATDGKASQVSVAYEGPAKLAIDGNTNGDYFAAKSTTHTAAADNPWWEVDLGKAVTIERIAVHNRSDGGVGSRLKNFRVIALGENRQPLWVGSVAKPPAPNVDVDVPPSGALFSDAERKALAAYGKPASPELAALDKKIAALAKQAAAIKGVSTPIFRELAPDKRRKTHIQLRGNFLVKAEEVTAGVPAVFHALEAEEANRLAVARWLVDPRNPLTARVTVNRYWEQLFGVGLVLTSEDFGTQGEPPSHPELLDFLATELVAQQWNIKGLLKLIVTSETYRQSSRSNEMLNQRDPDNRLLARGPRFRLSTEKIRDQALFAAGLLSRKMYGPSVRPPRPKLGLRAAFGGSTDWQTSAGEDKYRRGLYTSWRRTTPYPSMTTFDAPSREFCTLRRIRTNTPLQALVTLNDPVYVEAAQALARRTLAECGGDTAARATFAFRCCLARPPLPAELERLVKLFETTHARMAADAEAAKALATEPLGPAPAGANLAELAAWTVVGNVLLNLDEALSTR